MSTPLLLLEELTIEYGRGGVTVGPVDLAVRAGEIFGLVGESGGGKTSLSKAILNDLPRAASLPHGRILFDGASLKPGDEAGWRGLRWKRLAYIPQNALNALNPVRRIGAQFSDLVRDHEGAPLAGEWRQRVVDLLETVRLTPDVLARFPHELSGGMRQRVCIAMALLFGPKLIVADEPTSALDVVSQRTVLQTLMRVRDTFGTAILLVGHDMAVMAQVADRVGILFSGQLVECGPVSQVFANPAHAYTRRLLASVPSIRRQEGIPDIILPTDAERDAWRDRAVVMRPVGPDHHARVCLP